MKEESLRRWPQPVTTCSRSIHMRRRVPSTGRSPWRNWTIPGRSTVVAGRVLHHVHPLAPALDKLAALAPHLILDEFAWNHVDEPTIDWYESQHRVLVAAGREPKGPPSLAEWGARHADLHPYETLRAEIDARYDERHFEWRPYFYRWLEGPATESLEAGLIAAGAIRPIGFRYAGVSKETVRSPADLR
jgi:hypothetical protein